MHIGVMRFPTQHPLDIAVVARKAEELGFDSLWLGEHPIMPVQSAIPSCSRRKLPR
jgi:alkanesulfonate monooxygenase SsuD/methylene tetrahydromethanopterin reductase-like flavin-dependent oxidoreductase (luciferase family)